MHRESAFLLDVDFWVWYYRHSSMRGGAVAARRAHNPKVAGSSPAPATHKDHELIMVFVLKVCIIFGKSYPPPKDHDLIVVFIFKICTPYLDNRSTGSEQVLNPEDSPTLVAIKGEGSNSCSYDANGNVTCQVENGVIFK